MSLRGLDSYITGHWGDDYWGNKYDEYYGTFICAFCIASDHKHCISKHCGCPYRSPGDRTRMGREHQHKHGKLALVMDDRNRPVRTDQAPQRYAWDEPSWAETEDDAPLIPQGYKITGTMKVAKDEANGDEGKQPGPQEGAGLANRRNDNGDTDE